MKAIILAAGHGTRMKQLTKKAPKCLLQINGDIILELILENIGRVEEITETYIITNNLYYERLKIYNNWKGNNVYVISDNTSSNEERLGAIGDLRYCQNVADDNILIIASDYIYNFEFIDLCKKFIEVGRSINVVKFINDVETMKRLGCILLDDKGKIIKMVEKPLVPFSEYSSVPIYVYTKKDFKLLQQYTGGIDNIGSFLEFVVDRSQVDAYISDDVYDFGTTESYWATKRRLEK